MPYAQVADGMQALGPLAAAYYGHPSRRLTVIGVTGTDGKTTTSVLLHSILLAAGIRAGLLSTINAVIGDEALENRPACHHADCRRSADVPRPDGGRRADHAVIEATRTGWRRGGSTASLSTWP